MKTNQEIKFATVKAFAGDIVAGKTGSEFLPSRAQTRMVEIANILHNTSKHDVEQDDVKLSAFFSLYVDLQTAYKAASKVTVKEVNSADKVFRVQYEKLVMRYGKERADAMLAEREERVNKMLEIASR